MWRKCKNLSKDSSYTATVQSVPQFAPSCHMPQSIPSAFFPCSGTQAAANLMLLCCHRRVGAVWRIICEGSLALQSFESTSPDVCSRLLPAVTIRGHVSNVAVLKTMAPCIFGVHLWCPKRDSANSDGERELAGVGCSCKSRRQKSLKWHGREEVGRLGMRCRGRQYQILERLVKERGRQQLKQLGLVWRASTEQPKGRKGSLSFYF